MKKAHFKDLSPKYPHLSLLSYSRYLYLIANTQDNQQQQKNENSFTKFKILKTFTFESSIKYDLLKQSDLLVISEEQEKDVKFYPLQQIAEEEKSESFFGQLKEPRLVYANKKKVTDLIGVRIETKDKFIDGVLISDKVGEVKFINYDNLVNGQQQLKSENEQDNLAKILFGHYQECLALELTQDKNALISVDSLNRVRISDFPNVFNIRQVLINHKEKITDYELLNDKVVTYSALDNHLIVTDIYSGTIIKDKKGFDENGVIEGLIRNSKNQLGVLVLGKDNKTYTLYEFDSEFNNYKESIGDLKLEEGKNIKYLLADKQLIKVNIDPENGAIADQSLEIINL